MANEENESNELAPSPAPQSSPVILIQSFDQLQALVDKPLMVSFKLDGNIIQLPCKRASQVVDEKVREILRKAQPPWDDRRKELNYSAPKYLEERDRNQKIARAYAIYSCCPAIAAKNPGLTDENQIYQYVRGLLTETILEVIFLSIQVSGTEVVERANFTSPAPLES